jgi:hypothetical protein
MRILGVDPFLLLALIALLTAGCESMGFKEPDYHPQIDPSNFQETVDNPYYPLVPGTTLKYVEKDKGEVSDNVITVTHDTKVIMGVKCMVVHDQVLKEGHVAEDTYDWIAQDKQGNVWYFGEATKEISPGGLVSTKGSWEAGVKGGLPGILMPGNPKPGPAYRQEYGKGEAEDMGQVVLVGDSVTVPAGTYADCVKTKEWSLLEAGHENKWYAKGVGVVKEVATDGTVAELVSVTRP